MSDTYVAGTFTDQQLVDIRRFCGYPTQSDGTVLFPAPWVNREYLALDYRLQHFSIDETKTILTVYLPPLYVAQTAIQTMGTTLNVDMAGPFKRNSREMRERISLYNWLRRDLCAYMGIQPGPGLSQSDGSITLMV
jgi:hypothetical protein